MIDNCDMNIFDPEKMEIKPGKVSSFIPEYSKLIVSERSDSTFCIEFGIAGRDYEFEMSKEQAVKLARGIFTLSGEEIKQGEWIKAQGEWVTDTAYKIIFRCSECGGHFGYPFNFCPNCGARMGGSEE